MARRTAAIVFIVLFNSVAFAGDYWPHQLGAVYTYVNSEGNVLEVSYHSLGYRISNFHSGGIGLGYRVSEAMVEDASGDVYLSYVEGYQVGAIDPDYWRVLGDNFLYLDLPLDAGKSWGSLVETSCCYGPCTVWLYATVLGQTEVVVPAGTYSVVEVSFVNFNQQCAPDLPSGVVALHKDLGPIVLPGGYELLSIDGVVGVESETWGGLKAHYR